MSEQKTCDRMVRKPELLERVNVSDATIWRWEKQGRFPKRVQIGDNSVAWLSSEVEEWFAEKAEARKNAG
jgi:prophage regulatory protein